MEPEDGIVRPGHLDLGLGRHVRLDVLEELEHVGGDVAAADAQGQGDEKDWQRGATSTLSEHANSRIFCECLRPGAGMARVGAEALLLRLTRSDWGRSSLNGWLLI